jgi:hypothetical protein
MRSGRAPTAPPVSALLSRRCPADIPRFVIPIRLYPINRVFGRWGASNVFEERREIVQPLVADPNPSFAVPPIALGLGGKTASLHGFPCAVLLRPATPTKITMPKICGVAPFAVKTAATPGFSPQVGPAHDLFHSTVTPAKPSRFASAAPASESEHHVTAEPVARKINARRPQSSPLARLLEHVLFPPERRVSDPSPWQNSTCALSSATSRLSTAGSSHLGHTFFIAFRFTILPFLVYA